MHVNQSDATPPAEPRRRDATSAYAGSARILGCLTSALVLLGAGAACAPDASDTDGGGGARLTVALAEEPRTMGSWSAVSDEGTPWIYNVEEPLVMRNAETGSVDPLLATKWSQASPTTWRFTLRQGVKFHDGTAFNAEAAAAALNYTWDKANNFALLQFMGPQITAKAAGEYELDVNTAEPDPILPSRLFFSPIFSPQTLTKKTYDSDPVGTGPYRLAKWQRGQYLDLEPNDSWWGLAADSGQPRPTVKNVRFTFNSESSVRSSAVQAGDADLAIQLEPAQCKPQCVTTGSVETILLRLDAATNPMLKDSRVRKAIALGIDTKAIVEQYIPQGAQASQLVRPGVLGYNPDLKPYPHDVAEAKRLLAEAAAAGVPIDQPINVIDRNGFVPQGDQIVQVIQAQLTALGLKASSRVMENSQLQTGLRAKPAPADRGWALLYMHSNQLGDLSATVGWFTCAGAVSAMCDKALDTRAASAAEQTGEARQAAYAQVAADLYNTYAVLPIGRPARFYGARQGLKWVARNDGAVLVNTITLPGGAGR
ncbi:ABC transporter substrate-binding protein [Dactylosporangium sp. CA-233914]|uniref:ABC transporter substrate-binding protein n=1 Tax=Dactylosporangium sp. CA-233914 TaxID=3239934 RepID=UPI003D8DB8C4